MKLQKDITYKEFLEFIRDFAKEQSIPSFRKERLINNLEFLTEVDNIEIQNFIVSVTSEINSLVKREFNSKKTIEYDKLYEPACCLFELVNSRYEEINKLNSKEIASICYYLWPYDAKKIEEYKFFVFDKSLARTIHKKFPKSAELQVKSYLMIEKEYNEFGNYERFIEGTKEKINALTEQELKAIINDDDLEITLPF